VSLYGVALGPTIGGAGDFGDLLEVGGLGGGNLGAQASWVNPLPTPIHNRAPSISSPYLPEFRASTRTFWYLDVESMADYTGNRRARPDWRQSAEVSAEIEALRGTPL